ncbi:MAG: UDP-N-acetylmuramoyl-L-alanyl-D-glutamate--2,6-diaminopimelate ligase [Patescibacteria group bacterium]|nr:UDP-N-acetylmuramoyl-L-alanyl-D-glutamate--2,6-diaminopimelate ligase [Patescibacteria group bacterium]
MWQKTKNVYHLFIAIGATVWFGFAGKKLKIIGITGTDGKTTTVNLIFHILKTAGKRVSMISTVGANIHGKDISLGFHVTNPASISLQRFLKLAAQRVLEDNFLVLEVTSHGLDQNRVWGIPFAIAGITNVTHEHLDYHKTYENYVKTKAKLLKVAPIGVINKDDKSYPLLTKELMRFTHKKIITYGLTDADFTTQKYPYASLLPGDHNVYNCLLAIAICAELGIVEKDIRKGIETFVLPKGRTEVVYKKDFTVMVDFAHTPNSFEKLLTWLRPQVKGRLIHVFGSAAKRDESKRPEMGRIAGMYDDIIILTSEDPRNENPQKIMDEIENGMQKKKDLQVLRIVRREEAIIKAISLAQKGDLVVLTGKAHERSMNYGHGEEPWDEFAAVQKALQYT